MLNVFPIQFLALFAYFILRVCVGWILFWQGYRLLTKPVSPTITLPKHTLVIVGTIEIIIGLQFIVGFLTQIAALVTIVLSIYILLFASKQLRQLVPDMHFWFLLTAVSISLFITGAGIFAIDLPI